MFWPNRPDRRSIGNPGYAACEKHVSIQRLWWRFLPGVCRFAIEACGEGKREMQLPVHLIKDELKVFETRFKEAVRSQTPLLDRIMRFIVKRKGKQFQQLGKPLPSYVTVQLFPAFVVAKG